MKKIENTHIHFEGGNRILRGWALQKKKKKKIGHAWTLKIINENSEYKHNRR